MVRQADKQKSNNKTWLNNNEILMASVIPHKHIRKKLQCNNKSIKI